MIHVQQLLEILHDVDDDISARVEDHLRSQSGSLAEEAAFDLPYDFETPPTIH